MPRKQLVPDEIIDLLGTVIIVTGDENLQKRFHKAGFEPPGFGRVGEFVDLSYKAMVKAYFDTIMWDNREHVAKVLKIANEGLRRLWRGCWPLKDEATKTLEKHGLLFDGEKLIRVSQE